MKLMSPLVDQEALMAGNYVGVTEFYYGCPSVSWSDVVQGD